MFDKDKLISEFSEKELETPWEELPKSLLLSARYELARFAYERKKGTYKPSKCSYSDYLRTNKNKNVGFCQYILQHDV